MSKLFYRQHEYSSGSHQPLGASVNDYGVNFALWSARADRVQLVIWENPDSPRPTQIIDLSAGEHKTGKVWHIQVEGLRPDVRYGYRVDGPSSVGNRFDPEKVLLDPYARAIDRRFYRRERACVPGDNLHHCLRGIVVGDDHFDWGDDHHPAHTPEKSVIYELHVKGMTRHPSSGVEYPGTFAGLTEKLEYLKDLGVTAIELMPVQAFDDDIPFQNPQGQELVNYWGYTQMSFFALEPDYFARGDGQYLSEFKKLVKRAHELDLEVILDVVYNHTTEANENGPVISWRGIDNQSYYLLSPANRHYYLNYSGCDNTFNAGTLAGMRLIVDSLEYLAREFHVDGFRFDLGAIFYYTDFGFTHEPEIIHLINQSPILRSLKLIAEPWDATGLVLQGRFGGENWFEWNGEWKNRVRQFVNFGTQAENVKAHLRGSAPEFGFYHKNPAMSVNYAAAHDGFTLRDVVSYDYKHNEENGYYNRDGSNDNYSKNYGIEGETEDSGIRLTRQHKAFEMLSLTSQAPGMMMILMGDEMWRTQGGNNNAFAQDNSISWLNWGLLERYPIWCGRVKNLIKARTGR